MSPALGLHHRIRSCVIICVASSYWSLPHYFPFTQLVVTVLPFSSLFHYWVVIFLIVSLLRHARSFWFQLHRFVIVAVSKLQFRCCVTMSLRHHFRPCGHRFGPCVIVLVTATLFCSCVIGRHNCIILLFSSPCLHFGLCVIIFSPASSFSSLRHRLGHYNIIFVSASSCSSLPLLCSVI